MDCRAEAEKAMQWRSGTGANTFSQLVCWSCREDLKVVESFLDSIFLLQVLSCLQYNKSGLQDEDAYLAQIHVLIWYMCNMHDWRRLEAHLGGLGILPIQWSLAALVILTDWTSEPWSVIFSNRRFCFWQDFVWVFFLSDAHSILKLVTCYLYWIEV